MNERLINRTLLRFFDDCRGVPQGFDDANDYLRRRLARPSDSLTQRSLEFLTSAGYLERAEATPADNPLWKITASGTRQINKFVDRADLDPMLWEG